MACRRSSSRNDAAVDVYAIDDGRKGQGVGSTTWFEVIITRHHMQEKPTAGKRKRQVPRKGTSQMETTTFANRKLQHNHGASTN